MRSSAAPEGGHTGLAAEAGDCPILKEEGYVSNFKATEEEATR